MDSLAVALIHWDASRDARQAFVRDVVAAWRNVINLNHYDLAD